MTRLTRYFAALTKSYAKLASLTPIARGLPMFATSPRSGLRVLAWAPYLQNLAALVLLGTVAAALADYVFKVQAVEAFGRGDALLQ